MGAAGESAPAEIGCELRKGVFQISCQHEIHLLGLERGKARRVRDIAAALDRMQLDMARGVAAAADAVGDRADLRAERAVETVEHARLADARVACEGGYLSADALAQRVDAVARPRAHAQHLDAALPVGLIQLVARVRVGLVDDDERRDLLVYRDGCHLVDEKRVGHGRRGARDRYNKVEVRDRRTDEAVSARRDAHEIARPVRLHLKLNAVAHDGFPNGLAEFSARLALDQPFRRIHIIKSADALENNAFGQKYASFPHSARDAAAQCAVRPFVSFN